MAAKSGTATPETTTSETSGPELSYPRFEKHFTEFIGVAPNGHLWVEGRDCVRAGRDLRHAALRLERGAVASQPAPLPQAFESRYPVSRCCSPTSPTTASPCATWSIRRASAATASASTSLYLALLAGTDPRTLVLNGSNKSDEELEMASGTASASTWTPSTNSTAWPRRPRAWARRPRSASASNWSSRRWRVASERRPTARAASPSRDGTTNGHALRADRRDGEAGPPRHAWSQAQGDQLPPGKGQQRPRRLRPHGARTDRVVRPAARRDRLDAAPRRHRRRLAWGRPEKTGPGGGTTRRRRLTRTSPPPPVAPSPTNARSSTWPAGTAHRAGARHLGLDRHHPWPLGAVKEWPAHGKTWVNVDCSTNHLIRIPMAHWYHHIVAANKAAEPAPKRRRRWSGRCAASTTWATTAPCRPSGAAT